MTADVRPHGSRGGVLALPRPTLAFGLLLAASLLSGEEAIAVRELASPAEESSLTPFLAASEEGLFLSWLEPRGKGHALRVARWDGSSFAPASSVHLSERFFVNWADFPSVLPFGSNRLVAHWLEKASEGTYDYDVWVAISEDGGESFAEPVKLHRDGKLGEHGFVSLVPFGREGFAALWLDGRQMADDAEGAMAVAATIFDGDAFGREWLVDRRVCECCQTAMAPTAEGLLAVYRDRSPQEVRDMSTVRFVDGIWTEPRTLYADGWQIEGCPVNGPQVASEGDHLAVAWFTAANDDPRVQVVFSEDGGQSFSDPVRVGGKSPVGRVDIELVPAGALVAWIEHVEGGTGELLVQRLGPRAVAGEPISVAKTGSGRASGFPRMASFRGVVYVSWTESYERGGPSRVRLARLGTDGHGR